MQSSQRKRFWGPTRATSSRSPRTTPVIFPDSPGSMRGTGRRSRLDRLSVRQSSSKRVGIRALLSQPQNVGTGHLAQSPGHSAPATQRPAGIPSRTIYWLIAYLGQIAERISSDPFDRLTRVGRVTIACLRMNRDVQREARRSWMRLKLYPSIDLDGPMSRE